MYAIYLYLSLAMISLCADHIFLLPWTSFFFFFTFSIFKKRKKSLPSTFFVLLMTSFNLGHHQYLFRFVRFLWFDHHHRNTAATSNVIKIYRLAKWKTMMMVTNQKMTKDFSFLFVVFVFKKNLVCLSRCAFAI